MQMWPAAPALSLVPPGAWTRYSISWQMSCIAAHMHALLMAAMLTCLHLVKAPAEDAAVREADCVSPLIAALGVRQQRLSQSAMQQVSDCKYISRVERSTSHSGSAPLCVGNAAVQFSQQNPVIHISPRLCCSGAGVSQRGAGREAPGGAEGRGAGRGHRVPTARGGLPMPHCPSSKSMLTVL